VRAFLADSIRNTDAFLAGLIRRARDRKEIGANADPDALAAIATATLHTLAVRSRAGHSRKELSNLAATVIDAICGN
jgi:TetR/AcrR family transcriptional regulator, copper-responsive repressor